MLAQNCVDFVQPFWDLCAKTGTSMSFSHLNFFFFILLAISSTFLALLFNIFLFAHFLNLGSWLRKTIYILEVTKWALKGSGRIPAYLVISCALALSLLCPRKCKTLKKRFSSRPLNIYKYTIINIYTPSSGLHQTK